MNVLGIETSCDETAAAVVQNGRRVLSSVVASQMAVHRPFRGVVPELASRAHVERINDVIETALGPAKGKVDAIAVTTGPGLVGSLLIGVVTARTMGWVRDVPVVGVNHLEGHLFAGLVEHPGLKPPFLGLIVSGGHTELVIFKGYGHYKTLGKTRDDAAGEAFDKVATLLDLPFPGGPSIDRMARKGNPRAVPFPRAWIPGSWDFSFSGIKTSVANYLRLNNPLPSGERGRGEGMLPHPVARTSGDHLLPRREKVNIADLCASFQEAVVDVLVQKTLDAASAHGLKTVVVGGGVAANTRLRQAFQHAARSDGTRVFLPARSFCTDNAAMIAAAGYYRLTRAPQANSSNHLLKVDANLFVKNWNN